MANKDMGNRDNISKVTISKRMHNKGMASRATKVMVSRCTECNKGILSNGCNSSSMANRHTVASSTAWIHTASSKLSNQAWNGEMGAKEVERIKAALAQVTAVLIVVVAKAVNNSVAKQVAKQVANQLVANQLVELKGLPRNQQQSQQAK